MTFDLPRSELVLLDTETGEPVLVPEMGTYPDGAPFVKEPRALDPDVTGRLAMVLRPTTFTNFIAGLYYHDHLTELGFEVPDLVLPCIPAARQDRSNPTGDVLFTARAVAYDINQRRFDRVFVLDPHSPVSVNAIHAAVQTNLEAVAAQFAYVGRPANNPEPFSGIISPDKGAVERARLFGNALGLPVRQAEKTRDSATGRLSGFDVSVAEGCHYLVVDDICDGGGTFLGLGEKIREQGATASLYVSHGIFSRGVDVLKGLYRNVYTTDSTLFGHEGAVELPVVRDLITSIL